MADATDAVARCPQCRAVLRQDAPWCATCWAPVAPAVPRDESAFPAPLTSAQVKAEAPASAASELPVVLGRSGTWPCSCGGRTPLDQDLCVACGAGFLSALHEDAPTLVVPGVGDVGALSTGARTGLALLAVLCFLAVFTAVCLLLA